MSTVNEKMTTLANKIRTLSGTTESMGLDSMATKVNDANTEVSNQMDLIEQIVNALDGKASGGGNEGSVSNVATCTVTLKHNSCPIHSYFATSYTESSGIIPLINKESSGFEIVLQNIVCGSIITLKTINPVLVGYSVTGGAEFIYHNYQLWSFSIPQQPTGDIVITVRDDD